MKRRNLVGEEDSDEMENPAEETQRRLMEIGFGSYEARAYCALLMKSPANGYQVARQSGIPRAKIYECLERLVTRGAAVLVETGESDTRQYAPTDPEQLMEQIGEEINSSLEAARGALRRYRRNPGTVEVLWRVTSPGDLVARGQRLTDDAAETLHVAIWAEEFDAILPHLLGAVERGVRLALVLYSYHPGIDRLRQDNGGVILHSRTKRLAIPVMGRQYVLVADSRKCITGSIFPDNNVEGVFTRNLGLVTNAVDLVNHEIYLERVMVAFGDQLTAAFGQDLEKLNPFEPPGDGPV
jgi:sugar-specific transcriptional regulator TrmB